MSRHGAATAPCGLSAADHLSPKRHARRRTEKRFPCSSLAGRAAGLLELRLESGFADSNPSWFPRYSVEESCELTTSSESSSSGNLNPVYFTIHSSSL